MKTIQTSAYDVLLFLIRGAVTIDSNQKQTYIDRLEAGEWNNALRTELQALCKAEAAALHARRMEVNAMLKLQETFLVEEQARTAPEAEKILQRHEEEVQDILDGFAIECAKL